MSGPMAHPYWFRRSLIPLTVVCGPPGSGKSTYVRRHAGEGDLVICFDNIARRMFPTSDRMRPAGHLTAAQVADVLRARNEMIGDLFRPSSAARWQAAWLIVLEPKAEWRTWWRDRLGANVVVLATPADECRRRIAADAAAGDARGANALAYVATWWELYRQAERPARKPLFRSPGFA